MRQYPGMPAPLQAELRQRLQLFMGEKRFEGCGGLELTEDMAVAIAGQACVLLLGRADFDVFPALRTVLVYPTAFVANREEEDEHGFVHEEEVEEGESWEWGIVILSWEDVARDMEHLDGRNVVLHEFAHQLYDQGLLPTGTKEEREAWIETLAVHFKRHCRIVDRGQHTFLDEYGAEDEAEFFSVATEAFFEQPRAMKQKLPNLYLQFKHCFQQEPHLYFEGVS